MVFSLMWTCSGSYSPSRVSHLHYCDADIQPASKACESSDRRRAHSTKSPIGISIEVLQTLAHVLRNEYFLCRHVSWALEA